MTPDQIIIVREGTWNWVYYLGFAFVISFCAFFMFLFWKGLKLFHDRNALMELAAQDSKSRVVNITVWNSFVTSLLMVLVLFFCIWIIYQDMFNGFISAHISPDKLELNYLWPMPNKEISHGEIQMVESKYWGENSRVLVITTNAGRKIKSVSGDADDVRELCKDFLRTLELNPQKNSN